MRRIKHKTRAGIFSYRTPRGSQWGVDYRDPLTRRRRRKIGFASKAVAVEWQDRVERRLLGLMPREEVKEVLFRDAVAKYLETRVAAGKSARSYYHLEVPAKKGAHPGFWQRKFGNLPIRSITVDHVEEALRRQSRARRWSTATTNRALAQLSGVFTYAQSRSWVSEHPVERGKILRGVEDNARTRWLRLHEVEAVIQASPAWLGPIVRFAVSTGMRLGEICSLTCATYHVDQIGRAYVISERTKNGERLFWPLEGWPREHVADRVGASIGPGEYLFPGPDGGRAYTSVQRWLPEAICGAGLRYGRKHQDGVTFHTFRHSMASLALNHGVPEITVQRMGNWKTRAMVQRYAHLADEELRSAAGKLANLVSKNHLDSQPGTRPSKVSDSGAAYKMRTA